MSELFESDADLDVIEAKNERAGFVGREYREKLKRALIACGGFDGSRRGFEALMRVLSDFEVWLKNAFGEGELRLNDDREIELYRKYYGRRGRITIGDMLDVADGNFKRKLKKSAGEGKSFAGENGDILRIELPGVLLPPGEFVLQGKGERIEKKEVRFDERLRQLIGLLVKNGIFTDDIVVLRGKTDPTMMRKESYHLVEIPKMNKQILVCDQVGEATFVVDGIMSRETLMTLNKEQLQDQYGAKISRIVYRDCEQWESEVIKALLADSDARDYANVNVRERESLRQYITGKYTAEEWAGMKQIEKRQFEILRMKMKAIARRFGVQGNPVDNHNFHLLLGQKIYGTEHVCLRVEEKVEYGVEEVKKAILERFSTAEKWAKMKSGDKGEKKQFEVFGMKLKAIARKFGAKGDPIDYHYFHLLLGQKIYGTEHECLRVEEKVEYSAEEIKEAILGRVPTAEEWVKMKYREKKKFAVLGMKLNAMAGKFGVKGDPLDKRNIYKLVGQQIYGEVYECLRVEEKVDYSAEEIKEAILGRVPTAEVWAGMKPGEKEKFEILGMKLQAMARKFGVKGNPMGYLAVYLLLGQKIYGTEHECLRVKEKVEYSAEEVKEAILERVPTVEEWAGMKRIEKEKFEIPGMKLRAIARRFRVKGSPIENHYFHLLLGQMIYGTEHECLRVEPRVEYGAEEFKEAILEPMPTAEEWVGMKRIEKDKFEILGIKLIAIARKFGIKENPVQKHYFHKLLGQKIYGAEHECLRAEEKVEYGAVEIKEAILERVPTAEEWVGMKKMEKKQFAILGMKLRAIANKLGVKGSPIHNHNFHLLLGQKIYGTEHECLRVEEKIEYSNEEIRETILERVPTAEEWAGMKSGDKGQKRQFEVLGMKLIALARKFGVKGNPINNHYFHKLLGQKIYGAEHECLRVEGRE